MVSCVKGFAAKPGLAKKAGAIGGKRSKRGKSPARAERVAQAREMKAKGMKIGDIAKELDVTKCTIHIYLSED